MSFPPSPQIPPALDRIRTETSFEFHRLFRRDERYEWWRPLAGGAIAAGFFLVLSIGVGMAMAVVLMADPAFWSNDPAVLENSMLGGVLNMADTSTFVLTMFSLIVLIPAVWCAYLIMGPKPSGLLVSVAGRIRWKWLAVCLGACALAFAIYFAAMLGFDALTGASSSVPASSLPANPWLFALLVLLLTPFQCAAEELVFRGGLMQLLGSWLKHPAFAILIPVPFFAFGHLYDVYGLLDVSVFAVAAGYLAWRTGGLEAPVAMHIINNTFLFLLGAFGVVDLNASGSSLSGLLVSAVFTVVLTLILVKLADRHQIQRTAGPIEPRPRPQLLYPYPYPGPQPMGPYGYQGPPPAYWAPPASTPAPAFDPQADYYSQPPQHPGAKPPAQQQQPPHGPPAP